jgi:hypothetical protein
MQPNGQDQDSIIDDRRVRSAPLLCRGRLALYPRRRFVLRRRALLRSG